MRFAILLTAIALAGCTASERAQTTTTSNPAATDSNGMGTTSAATASPEAQPAPAKDDPNAAVKKQMDATRPGTEHDATGGNDSQK